MFRISQRFKFAVLLAACLGITATANADDSSPPWSQADAYWGADAMATARRAVQSASGAAPQLFLMADRFEGRFSGGDEVVLWDAQGWYGYDINKLWVKSEGEWLVGERVEDAELQALWSRAISSFWDVQAGIRFDAKPDTRFHAVVGMQGLARQWLEIDAAAFLSDKGDLTTRIEAEYELHLTQRLILQPRAEFELSTRDIPERDVGAWAPSINLGARLRYELIREIAPYVGVEWQKAFGETGNRIEADGGDDDAPVFVLGIRSWF